jgi:hypothetical protein
VNPSGDDPWPSHATRLLLQAALLDGDAADAAFSRWLEIHPVADAGTLSETDRRLLPLLARKLRAGAIGHGHAWAEAGAAVGRRTAARNDRLLRAGSEVASCLAAAGVEVIALKGLPLLLEYYQDPSLRPMSDIDLLVRPVDLRAAIAALGRAGWRLQGGHIYEGLLSHLGSCDFRRGDGVKLDLHQHLIEHGALPPARPSLWPRRHSLDLRGTACFAPEAADLLFHVCVAGVKFGHNKNARWVADASTVLGRAGAALRWDVVVEEAVERRLVLPLRECLGYLTGLGIVVPAAVLERLDRQRVGRGDRLAYRLLRRHSRTLGQLFEEYLWLYLSGARASGHRAGPWGFLSFCAFLLVHRWGLQRVSQVPATAFGRLTGRPQRNLAPHVH